MESLMHYVWQHRLFPSSRLMTVDGRRISVINPGLHNQDAGPDFFNATVKIGDDTWVGNVEIHVKASDWYRHRHDSDAAYDSVILHVVDVDDMPVKRQNGQIIPQFRMPCSRGLNASFHALTDFAPSSLPCASGLRNIDPIYLTDWIGSLGYERLIGKSSRVLEIVSSFSGDWEGAAFVTLSRALGFGVNSEPFEQLARLIGPKIMQKCSHTHQSAEALLLGAAGFLEPFDEHDDETYGGQLKREYLFLCNKFGLRFHNRPAWKMSRMRPGNSPQRRLATLARLMSAEGSLLSRLLEAETIETARAIFTLPLTGFWADRYTLDGPPAALTTGMTVASANSLIINALVPIVHAYGTFTAQHEFCDRAVAFLEELKPEDNRIVKMFELSGIKSRDAFTSQALIQLRREYCERSKCLYCRVGHRLLAEGALRKS